MQGQQNEQGQQDGHSQQDGQAQKNGQERRARLMAAFSIVPELATVAQRAFDQAHAYRFGVIGVEHLLFELGNVDAFNQMIKKAGGSPALLQKSLLAAFREHRSFAVQDAPYPEIGEDIAAITRDIAEQADLYPGQSQPELLSSCLIAVLNAVDGSMIAEVGLTEAGAQKLLSERGDTSFFEDQLDYVTFPGDVDHGPGPVMTTTAYRETPAPGNDTPASQPENPAGPESASGSEDPLVQSVLDAESREAEYPDFQETMRRQQAKRSSVKEDPVAEAVNGALRNLGEAADMGDLDPVLGRDAEIDHIISCLRRRRKGSVMIYGDAGIGKTAIAEGVAQRLRSGTEGALGDRPFYELSITDIVAGTKYRGDFEAKIRKLLERMKAENAILFVDEIHMLMGSGSTYGRGMDGANMFKPALARGELTIIGATTSSEMRSLRQDAALMRRFETLPVVEQSREEVERILEGAAWTYLEHHRLIMDPACIPEICRITDLHQPERRFPDKAFDLLDAACVIAASQYPARTGERAELRVEHVGMAADRAGIRRPRLPDRQTLARLGALQAALAARVPGQDQAHAEISSRAMAASFGMNGSGPRAVSLLAGPAGCGLSDAVDQVARSLRLPLVDIDLGMLQDRTAPSHLLGNPMVQDMPGLITEAVDSHRDMVLHLRNVDRCDQSAVDIVEKILADGMVRSGDGRLLSLRGAWIYLTVTAEGRDGLARTGFGAQPEEAEVMQTVILKSLRPSLIDLTGPAVMFGKAGAGAMLDILTQGLAYVHRALDELGVKLASTPETLERLSSACSSAEEARALPERQILPAIARHLAADPKGERLTLLAGADGKPLISG